MELNKWAKDWAKENKLEIKDKEQAEWIYRMMDWFAMSTLQQVNKNNGIHSVSERFLKGELSVNAARKELGLKPLE